MKVIPGQIWQDLDKRMWKRRVKVLSVNEFYADVQTIPDGRKSRISLRRMHPIYNGFQLVGGVGIDFPHGHREA